MTVSLAVFIFIWASISSRKVYAQSVQHSNTSERIPQILYPCNNTIEALAGSKLKITCRVLAELHTTVEILVYWLANQSYIEDYSNSSRVTEVRTERRETEESYIEVDLCFLEVTKKDFEIDFVCVVLSEEMAQERFIFIKPAGVSDVASRIVVPVVLVIIIVVSIGMYMLLKSKQSPSYEILH